MGGLEVEGSWSVVGLPFYWYHTAYTYNIVLGFLRNMEANFSLHTDKKLVPFLKRFMDKRLKGLFLFKDEWLYESVKMMLGEEIVHVIHHYRTNREAYRLIFAWSFQFEDEVEKVIKCSKSCN